MVKIGSEYEKFDDYVLKSQRYSQRTLVVYMIKSGESLEWVVDQIMSGRRIKNVN